MQYSFIDELSLLTRGILLGLILMAGIYNMAFFYFNKEKSYLYYFLLQISTIFILLLHIDFIAIYMEQYFEGFYVYGYIAFINATFSILFIRHFLDTKKYIPKYDKVLSVFLFLLFLDAVFYIKPIINDYRLYSVFSLILLYMAYLRIRQGFKPAYFFIFGWGSLIVGIFIWENYVPIIDSMLIGSSIESISFGLALSFKSKEQNKLIVEQNKLVSMGEMLGNIAHQWRQPLTHLSYLFMNLEYLQDQDKRSKKVVEGTKQLEFMSQTIDDFQNFYAQNKQKEFFFIKNEIEYVLTLIDLSGIDIQLKIEKNRKLFNYKNEFKQVLLNLLGNAKEALRENKIDSPKIIITVLSNTIRIHDNAGGILKNNLIKIFEPYFTTKDKGTGIGLYVSKIIVEQNMQGILKVENKDDGALFSIVL